MNHEIIEKIREHYEHAKAKHPYFCDKLTYDDKDNVDQALFISRMILNDRINRSHVSFLDVLTCEMFESLNEMVDGNNERAIEELLDMIAVCLRGIDVLEGRQELGNPAKKSNNN